MTLEPYDAEQLDQLALRLFDVTAILRKMAENQRQEAVEEFLLHDKKALEWIDRLEQWARRAEADMQMQILKSQATADADRATRYRRPAKRTARRKKST